MYTEKDARELLMRYRTGRCTDEDVALLQRWYLQLASETAFDPVAVEKYAQRDNFWKEIVPPRNNPKPMNLRFWPAAAGLALILSAGTVSYLLYNKRQEKINKFTKEPDVQPGISRATLTLEDGREIDLNAFGEGSLVNLPENVEIIKTNNEELVYRSGNMTSSSYTTNTLTTPMGGQYKIVLPDGTEAFLHPGSKLTFPTRFNTRERRIKLLGEAYFAVAKDLDRPFIVEGPVQTAKVTGTHFDARYYSDEASRTLLTEGTVEVFSSDTSKPQRYVLRPGMEATSGQDKIYVCSADTLSVVAWKSGMFIFSKTPIKEALRQISRWYNVDVDYNSLPDGNLTAGLKKDLPLSKVFETIKDVNHIQLGLKGGMIQVVKP